MDKVKRKCFYSFHYKPDNWRAGQVRNMGVIEGNAPVTDNAWETVTKGGDTAIEKWISDQMYGKSCTVLLIGENTSGRKWINHEIKKTWNDGKGIVGIYIHNLQDVDKKQAKKGGNPFDNVSVLKNGTSVKLSTVVKAYDPPYTISTNVYEHIKLNLSSWVEEAIKIRNDFVS